MKLDEMLEKMKLSCKIKNNFEIRGIDNIISANKFHISYAEEEHKYHIPLTKAGALILTPELFEEFHNELDTNLIISDCPSLTVAYISHLFEKHEFDGYINNEIIQPKIGAESVIMPNVYIGSNVEIGKKCVIMPGVVISDNVEIGNNCYIYPNVVIYSNTEINNRVRIHAGSIIGSDGYGYIQSDDNKHIKVIHSGKVIIEDDVEIGANTTIDRALHGITIVKRGTKIDNLVQIGRGCKIGENNLLIAQSGLANNTLTGKNVIMGGQSGSAGNLEIGDFTQVNSRGAVSKDLPASKKYSGYPIMELHEWLKYNARIKKLVQEYFKDK